MSLRYGDDRGGRFRQLATFSERLCFVYRLFPLVGMALELSYDKYGARCQVSSRSVFTPLLTWPPPWRARDIAPYVYQVTLSGDVVARCEGAEPRCPRPCALSVSVSVAIRG